MGATAYDLYDLGRTAVNYAQGDATKAELGITVAGAGVGLFSFGGGFGRAGREALEAGARGLSNLTEKLAYDQLSSGVRAGQGVILAGGTHRTAFREAAAYAERYGGQASDWAKKSTTQSISTAGGNVHQIHWVENLRTGEMVDVKLKTVAKPN